MRAALDTNLPVDAEGFGDQDRVGATRALLQRLTDSEWGPWNSMPTSASALCWTPMP
jgi:hypothetical protein